MLEEDEQQAFARLAVFAGGCTVEALPSVSATQTWTRSESLTGNSLLYSRGERFRMLLTIREYARECLLASEEAVSIARRTRRDAVRCGRGICERAPTRSKPCPFSRLEAELENIRVAIRAALAWPDDPLALHLTVALSSFWRFSGRQAEGLRRTVLALEQTKDVPASDRAAGLQAAAVLATLAADAEEGRAYGEEALALYRADGDELGAAEVLPGLAAAHLQAGDPDRARMLHAESLALQERLGSPTLSRALRFAAEDELTMGDPIHANDLFDQALEIARSAELEGEVVMILHGLGDVCLVRREAAAAADFYVEALRSSVDETTAHCLAGLAAVAALDQRVELAGVPGARSSPISRSSANRSSSPTPRHVRGGVRAGRRVPLPTRRCRRPNLTLEEAMPAAWKTYGGQQAQYRLG